MAQRIGALRFCRRFFSASATTGSAGAAEIGVQDFLKGVGKGVEAHADKVAGEVGSFSELLRVRSGTLKKLGIPCQQRKLIMRFTEKYRRGEWRPRELKA